METQIMVPGILVALKTSVNGGVHYVRRDLDPEITEDESGALTASVTRWETTRTMDDPEEHEKATTLSSKASWTVAKLCVRTSFGYLCPTSREAEFDAAVTEMREMVSAWNKQAKFSFINISAIKGRIADNDEEAVRAILEEAKELMERMDRGLSEADVKIIRDAATRAKRLSVMMTDETSGQVTAALNAARQAAKAIVKRGNDIGDKVQNAVVEVEKESFDKARFSFLDTMEAAIESLPSVNAQRGADLEID